MSDLTDEERAKLFNEAVLKSQRDMLDQNEPELAQLLNHLLNLPVDEAALLHRVIESERGGEI